MNFTHLHLHNQYSVLDGIGTSRQYAERAKELGQTHLAISNHGNCDGAIDHQKQCKAVGIKPIIGCEMYMVEDISNKVKKETRHHITLLVENETGWQNLLKMLTIANLQGHYYRPRIDQNILLNHLEGLIILTGCSLSFLHMENGKEILDDIVDILGNNKVFLEVMPFNISEQIKTNKLCQQLSKEYGLNLVATNDCHYPTNESALHQEVLLAIQSKKSWDDKTRWKFNCTGLYLRSYEEMVQAFTEQNILSEIEINKALRWTTRIAKMCEGFEIKQQPVRLPSIAEFKSEEEEIDFLWKQIVRGMKRRLNLEDDEEHTKYSTRIGEEFELIKKMKFHRYFLIVWDLINWCRLNGILTGPGRGSVGGSLIAYLLGITDVDPIVHNLVFFRFISPDRNDLPDIDLDFEDHKRGQVRKYLEDKYGQNNVAGLSTFMTMKGKGVLRDVSRVFEIPLKEVDTAAKAINDENKNNQQIKGSFDNIVECINFKRKYPKVVEIAENLEGQVRGTGQHAAAICISDEDLTKGTKCNLTIKSGQVVANWGKEEAEFMGLMKLDVLGLSALSVLNETRKMIKVNHGIDINFQDIPLNDPKVFAQINSGFTIGAFQIGTYGLTKYCCDLGIDNFELLSAATALFRPGPLDSGMAEEFIKRKHKKIKIKSIHPAYDEITKSTLGIIVYQEQVMQVINKLSGIPMDICDKIRKLMAKSKGKEALNKYKEQFFEGCLNKRTIDKKKAAEVWKTIETFGSYGFNKCLTGDTIVIRASGNQYQPKEVSITDLFNGQESDTSWGAKIRRYGIEILQMDDDARIRPGRIKKIHDSGIQKTFEIITNSGKKIKATANHRFLTPDGYKEVSKIKIGGLLICQGEKEKRINVGFSCCNKGKTYNGMGWQKGKDNICFVDGRTEGLRRAKRRVIAHSGNKCENCLLEDNGNKHFLEFAHIDSLESFGGDYSKYHNHKNIKHLCNSCHKKLDYQIGVRKKRWSKGLPTVIEQVISIKDIGLQQTYDIEMETKEHNFIANGFVSHNSHAVEYSVITVWDMWFKTYYPREFIACSLTFGSKDMAPKFIAESKRLKMKLKLPKIGISKAKDWVVDKEGNLYAPFISINGVGDNIALNLENIVVEKPKNKGFFTSDRQETSIKGINKTIAAILAQIHAYEKDWDFTPVEYNKIKHLFSF